LLEEFFEVEIKYISGRAQQIQNFVGGEKGLK